MSRRLVVVWRAAVGLLTCVTLAAGLWTADAMRDRADAPVRLEAVPAAAGTTTADHDGDRVGETVFVLLLGSDQRPGLGGARTDAMHLVGLNPALGQATILNFPRDTYVEIPGHGRGRINTAYSLGGAPLAVDTVERLTGIRARYAMTTTFVGLAEMVDRLGGLDVEVTVRHDDRSSGAFFDPGLVHMDGGQVLAYSRNRHIPDGDLRRTEHQGAVVVHALAKLRGLGTRPADVLGYLDVLFRGVALDGVSTVDAYRLGKAALAVDPAAVRNVTIPTSFGNVGGASVVFARPEAGELYADLADDGVLQSH